MIKDALTHSRWFPNKSEFDQFHFLAVICCQCRDSVARALMSSDVHILTYYYSTQRLTNRHINKHIASVTRPSSLMFEAPSFNNYYHNEVNVIHVCRMFNTTH